LAAKSVKEELLLFLRADVVSTVTLPLMEAYNSTRELSSWLTASERRTFAHEVGGGSDPTRVGWRKRSIAIVEDEEDLLSIYSTYLNSQGYDTVYSFVNGEDFVKAVSDGRLSPDLVIMDYRLPGMDGIEVGKEVIEVNPRIRILVTTADDKIKAKAKTLGFHFLLKPFTLRALAKALEDL
jgi:two-component system, response regulator, stage 0 sporulation protein F